MTPGLSRRRLLGGVLGLGAAVALAGCGAGAPPPTRRAPARPLAIPPLAPSRVDGAGRRVFDLVARAGTSSFDGMTATPTWGYGSASGQLPFGGPTLRAARGEEVAVRVTNALDETTTTHWHGMTVPARADGGPHQPIAPGATWEAAWRVDQPAATLWYHPHPHGATERHVHRGLAGMLLVDDRAGEVPGLPSRYGVDDVPVIVTDRSFAPDGSFDERHRDAQGLLGDTVLVNGTVAPWFDATTARVRLRLLNASPARSYRFGFDDGTPLTLVGTDGGLVPVPHRVPAVVLTPGERAEVLVDLEPGRRTMLRSLPHTLGAPRATARAIGSLDTLDVLELRAAGRLEPVSALPPVPASETPLDEARATATRRFVLGPNDIDGRLMDTGRIDAVLTAGTTELWELRNRHTLPHNLHVHDARMQVLDDRTAPGARPWKDTVLVPPTSTVRVLLRVGPHTDPVLPYMFHCHLLRHEDDGMMGQFLVLGPGQESAAVGPGRVTGHQHG